MAQGHARRDVLRAVGGGPEAGGLRPRAAVLRARGEPPAVCTLCLGTGLEVVPKRGARRCECKREEDRQRLIESANIPARYRACSLDNFEPAQGNGTHLRALAHAHKLVQDYPGVDKGLLFAGPCGVGKSHLAAAILNGLMAKGVRCLFYEFGALLRQIQDSYNRASGVTEMGVLAPVYEAEVLLLDELGAVRPTEWVRDTVMQVINTRYNAKRLTVFTTNYLDERTGPGDETLEERVGVRLRSRLYEMCRTVFVDGEDYRRRPGGAV